MGDLICPLCDIDGRLPKEGEGCPMCTRTRTAYYSAKRGNTMNSLQQLKSLAAEPGGYGDNITAQMLYGGGLKITRLDDDRSTVFDPDQTEKLAALICVDKQVLVDNVSDRIMKDWRETSDSAGGEILAGLLLFGGAGLISGLLLGIFLF